MKNNHAVDCTIASPLVANKTEGTQCACAGQLSSAGSVQCNWRAASSLLVSVFICVWYLGCVLQDTPKLLQGFSFIAAPSTAALSHRMPTSAGVSSDSYGAQDSDKRNAAYIAHAILTSSLYSLNPSNNKSHVLWWVVHIGRPGRSDL